MSSPISQVVAERMRQFEQVGSKNSCAIFNEMCFCILTANYQAKRAIMIQQSLGDGFEKLPRHRLAKRLKELGHRFPNARSAYIVDARSHRGGLARRLRSFNSESEVRDWVVDNVKGLGLKEASHFLRNVGFKELAIIDFHIVDVLVEYAIIKRPKYLSKRAYSDIEGKLRVLAKKCGISVAELDLYLWYMETGQVLK